MYAEQACSQMSSDITRSSSSTGYYNGAAVKEVMEKRERGKSRSEGQERAAFSSAASPEY